MKWLFLAIAFFLGLDANAQCPIIFSITNEDFAICELESFIFSVQFDDADLAQVTWELPDGTTSNDLSVGYNFPSESGCNEEFPFAYTILCENGDLLEAGEFVVTAYTFNEAIVEVDNCTYTVRPDCPEDVVVSGGSEGNGVHIASDGEMGIVPFLIDNMDAPDDCRWNGFDYNYDCTISGIEDLENAALVYFENGKLYFNDVLQSKEVLRADVYDLSGRLLQSVPLPNSEPIVLQKISSRILLVQLHTHKGAFSRKVFLR